MKSYETMERKHKCFCRCTLVVPWLKYKFLQIIIVCLEQRMYDAYNTIENHEWIPKEAFLYFPQGSSTTRQQDDYKIIIKNEIKRLIYEGGLEYLDEEMLKINQFKQFLKNKEITLNKRWSKTYIYKFLQSAGYDYKRTLKEILLHNQYKVNLQAQEFDELRKFAQPFLKQGPFYFNGRDAKYRPIIICDIAKIHQMKMTEEQLDKSLQYFFEFMYRNMFINGQVENVVGIIDIGFTSPMDLVKPMKMAIGFLQGNYKYKLHAIFIVRSSSMFQFFYSIAQHLMKEDTIRKISVIEKNQPITKLLQIANVSQIQQRFGGTHSNLKTGQFWPPKQFSDDFSHPLVKRNIISQQQYREKFRNGLLPGRKIHLSLIEDQSESSNELPLINETKSVEIHFKMSGTKHVQKKEKNIFQRAMYKIMCQGCFTTQKNLSRKINKR